MLDLQSKAEGNGRYPLHQLSSIIFQSWLLPPMGQAAKQPIETPLSQLSDEQFRPLVEALAELMAGY